MKEIMIIKKMRKKTEQCMTEQSQAVARPFLILSLAFLISHFSFLVCNAQTFTQRIQQTNKGEGTVTIHHDQAIDDLVNGTHSATTTKTGNSKQPAAKTTPKPVRTPAKEERKTANEQHNATTVNEAPRQDSAPDTIGKPKQMHKAIGYRIQVFAGGNTRKDRQKAEKTGNVLKQLFPEEEVYVHFYSPRWICRLGNYRTYEEAKEKVDEIRKLGYQSATIVKGKILVAE